jgi:hypothetical protein
MTGTTSSRLARCHRSRPARRRTPSSGDSPATTTTLFPLPIPPFNMFKHTRPTTFILPSHRSACPLFSHDRPLSLYRTSFFHLSLQPSQRIRTPRNVQAIRPSDQLTPRSRPRLADHRKRSTIREKWMSTECYPSTHDYHTQLRTPLSPLSAYILTHLHGICRTKSCTSPWWRSTPKSRTSSTKGHGDSSLDSSSSRQR